MDKTIVYETSEDVVNDQKKKLKTYKHLIKENTTRCQRFPVVHMNRFPKLDKYSLYIDSKGCDDYIDHKVNKLLRQILSESNDTESSTETKVNTKRKYEDMIDLYAINEENEELDFEEDTPKYMKTETTNDKSKTRTESNHSNGAKNENKWTKLKSLDNKIESQKPSYKYIPSHRNGSNGHSNGLSLNGNTNTTFKIPKKDPQNIDTIIERTRERKDNKQWVEAFDIFTKNLKNEHWIQENVISLLVEIAKGMAASNDLNGNKFNHFNALIDKLKSLRFIDDEFWDEIIFTATKKIDTKSSTQMNAFLSGLHDFLLDNKISARLICTEAVVIAYRIQNKHPSAKDLLELSNPILQPIIA